jgi:hypothetical protein
MKLSEKEVIKHSATIQITNRISLIQRRAWNILLANAYDDLPRKDRYQINIKDLMDILGLERSNHDRYIKEACKALVGCLIEWNILGKDGEIEWGFSGLLASAKAKDGVLTYTYSPELRDRLYNPKMYARIKLSIQNRFSSKHALAIYELCVDYFIEKMKHGETPWIEIEEYRKLMGLKDNEYPDFKKLSKRVIKDPLEEINEKSDLIVKVEYKRQGLKVAALKFHIWPKPEAIELLEAPSCQTLEALQTVKNAELIESPRANSQLERKLVDYFCLSSHQAAEVLRYFSPDYIEEKLLGIEREYKKGHISKLGAYAYRALMENFNFKETAFEKEKRQKEIEQTVKRKRLEEQKEFIKRLQREFEEEVRKEEQRLIDSFSARELEERRTEFEQEVIAKNKGFPELYKEYCFSSSLFQGEFRRFLLKKYGADPLKNFVDYAKLRGVDLIKSVKGEYVTTELAENGS